MKTQLRIVFLKVAEFLPRIRPRRPPERNLEHAPVGLPTGRPQATCGFIASSLTNGISTS